MGSRLASLGAGIAAGILFLCRYALGFGYWAGAQADAFASLPLTAAGLTMLAAEHRRSWPLAALCGVLIGLAIVIKFTLGIFFLLPMIALAVSRDERVTDRGRRAAAYLLGGLGVVAVAIFPVWRGHALKDMLEIMFSWDLHYAALGTSGLGIIIAQTWGFWWGHAYAIVELIGLLALVGLTDLALRRDAGRFRWLAPAWLALMLIQVHVQAKYFNYQWLPAVPPLGLLAGIGVAALWRLLRERTGSVGTAGWLAAPGMVVLLAALAAGYKAQFGNEIAFATGRMSATTFAGYFKAGQDFSLSADLQVAAFLKRNTAPDASVFIWGFEPIIYFLAERPPASRFISQQPLITPWSPLEWRDELLRELAQRRPQYILVVHNDAIPWATSRHVDSARELAHFPALADLLRREYRLKVVIEDFDIWQRLRSS